MLKSLMLAVACAYINPVGLEPNAPVVQPSASDPEAGLCHEAGYAEGDRHRHGDGLCSKVMIEPSTDEALDAFIDPDAAENFAVPLPRPR